MNENNNKTLKITLEKSFSGRLPNHIACAKALGLRHRGHSVMVVDNPTTRGLIFKVGYMLKVEEV